jgi:hypothetical protein
MNHRPVLVTSLLFVMTGPFALPAQSEGQMLPPAQCYIEEFCVTADLQGGDQLSGPTYWGVTGEPTFVHSECLACLDTDGDNGICH